MKSSIAIALLSCLFAVSACKTTPTTNANRSVTITSQTTPSVISQAIKQGIIKAAKRGWIPEKVTDQYVVAGLHYGGRYMQVTYTISPNSVDSKITGSDRLNQSEERIHKKALAWKNRLDQYVFIEVAKTQ